MKGNEPINPTIWDSRHNPSFERDNDGITKREYFAAMALSSFFGGEYIGQSGMPDDQIAERCVSVADALIKALNK